MHIAVFGANGRTGIEVARQSREQGHTVTAFVRNAKTIEDVREELNLTVVTGDATELTLVLEAIKGADVVVSTIGGGGKDLDKPRTLLKDTNATIVQAMQQLGIRRIITVGTKGLTPTDEVPFRGDISHPSPMLNAFRDHKAGVEVLKESGLDWTTICPPRLTMDATEGAYDYVIEGFPEPGRVASRADVAHCVLRFLTDPASFGKRIGMARPEPAS